MWQEFSRLLSGKSGRIVISLLNIILLYTYVNKWVFGNEISISWMIIHMVVVSTLTYVAVETLFPESGDAIRQFYSNFYNVLSGLLSLFFFSWTAYLVISESTKLLFYAVSIALGTAFLFDFISNMGREEV